MARQERRSFMATIIGGGSVLLSGCSGSGSSNQDGGDGGSGRLSNNRTPIRKTLIDQLITVREDEYRSWSWSTDQNTDIEIEVTVRRGPRVDIFWTTADEYAQFEAGNRYRVLSNLSLSDTVGGRRNSTVGPGDYRFVIDNTNRGAAQPPTNFDEDPADVEVTVIGEIDV